MSARAVNWAWTQQLEPLPKFVLVALADRSDDEGVCWPSVRWLTRKTAIPERSVRQYVRIIREKGLVITRTRKRDDGGQTSNEFRLAIPAGFGGYAADAGGSATDTPAGGKAIAEAPGKAPAGQETSKGDKNRRNSIPSTSQAAAAVEKKLIYPTKLPHGLHGDIDRLVADLDERAAQLVVDELDGAMRYGRKPVNEPIALLKFFVEQYRAGKFVSSHAPLVQVEREGSQVQAEVAAARAAGRLLMADDRDI